MVIFHEIAKLPIKNLAKVSRYMVVYHTHTFTFELTASVHMTYLHCVYTSTCTRQKSDPSPSEVVIGISRVRSMLPKKMVTYVITLNALEHTSL